MSIELQASEKQQKQHQQTSQKSLYETDFVGWVETTVEQLQAQNYREVDWENLIEEIADISRRERKRLKSNLMLTLTATQLFGWLKMKR